MRIKTTSVLISLLAAALIITNAWWAYRLMDAAVSYTYQGVSLEEKQQALSQALAIIKVLGTDQASREKILAAVQRTWGKTEPVEEDGCICWVGGLCLRFNDAGHLVEAVEEAWRECKKR